MADREGEVLEVFATKRRDRRAALRLPAQHPLLSLLAPRTKARTHDTAFTLLGQESLGKPRRQSWAPSIRKSFGVDPLLDEQGDRMHWVGRLPATRH